MFGIILAALIGANTAAPSPNLAGVALNAVAADVVAKNPGAKKLSDQLGWKWTTLKGALHFAIRRAQRLGATLTATEKKP